MIFVAGVFMTNLEYLYIHIPFCSGKCSYCSFFSKPYNEDVADKYIESLIKELKYYQVIYKLYPKTIYIGGGTPTTLTVVQLEKLFTALSGFKAVKEFTIETNPGLLNEEKIQLFKKYGVNRLSIGVQSLDDDVLRYLNRRHSVADVEKTIELLKENDFTNVSVDLISSLPDVSEQDWRRTVERAVLWDVKHMSVYCLSIEEGSKFAGMIENGELSPNTINEELRMGAIAFDILKGAGYKRYEISNYAKSGFECKHNLAYWQGKNFLGVGASASSRLGLKRFTNVESIEKYIELIEKNLFENLFETEILSEKDDEVERLMFMLRLEEGIPVENFDISKDLIEKLNELVKLGMVEFADNRYKVRLNKRELTNSICEFLV
jgi:oxygen-independent coproporphyrinogen III oxidase